MTNLPPIIDRIKRQLATGNAIWVDDVRTLVGELFDDTLITEEWLKANCKSDWPGSYVIADKAQVFCLGDVSLVSIGDDYAACTRQITTRGQVRLLMEGLK